MVDEADEQAPLLRVARIEVEGLFGLYSHRIELNLDERVTILHGPNGVGKTMLLRMVDFVLGGRWYGLGTVPFRLFHVHFTDGTLLQAHRLDETPHSHIPAITVVLERPDLQPVEHCFEWPIDDSSRRKRIAFGFGDMAQFGRSFSPLAQMQTERTEPDWLTHFRGHVDTHLIGVERLLGTLNQDLEFQDAASRTVVKYAADLAERIEQTQARYGRQSQGLDQSFPQRLIESSMMAADLSALRNQMQELDRKRTVLTRIDLLDDTPQGPFKIASLDEIQPAQRSVMALYAHDTAEKLSVFDDLAQRIELLLGIINAKFRHKRLRVDRKRGLVVEPAGYQGPPIALDALSSGEQHELVLHYDLLFRIRPNTLVLIDEPELSLHVVWQKRFLPDLLKIVAVAGIDVLVATHSPYIIGEHRDLTVELSDDLP